MKSGMKQHVGEATELPETCKALHQVVFVAMSVHPQKLLKMPNLTDSFYLNIPLHTMFGFSFSRGTSPFCLRDM